MLIINSDEKCIIRLILITRHIIIIFRTGLQSFSDETFSGTHVHTTHESSTDVSYQYTDLNSSYVSVHIDVL